MNKEIIEQLLDAGIVWYAKTAPDRFVLGVDEYKVGDLVYAQLDDAEDPSAGVYIVPVPIALIKGEGVQEPAVSTNCGQGDFTDKQRKAIREMIRVSQEVGEVD